MSFTPVKNVRISSLPVGAYAELRFGKAAVRSADDVTVQAKLVEISAEGQQSIVVFEEPAVEGEAKLTKVTRFPGAAWRSGDKYVSLVGVDESTFPLTKPASPLQTDSLDEAIRLIEATREDVDAPDELIVLLTKIRDGKRVNSYIKEAAIDFAAALVKELSSLPDATA